MRTLEQAVASMKEQLAARLAAGQPSRIESVDAVLCEDRQSVVVYTWFEGDDGVLAGFDLFPEEIFDRDLLRIAFTAAAELSRAEYLWSFN